MKVGLIIFLNLLAIVYSVPLLENHKGRPCDGRKNTCSKDSGPSPQQLCEVCNLVIPIARNLVVKNDTKYFGDIAIGVCIGLKLAEFYVCEQAVNLFKVKKIVYKIFMNGIWLKENF